MPGIVNSHRALIRKNAKFIRLRHLRNNKGSLFLSDLDTDENKHGNNKIPVYVPYGETVDILLTDRTLTSYQQGSIRGFIDQNFLEGFVVQNLEIEENQGVPVPVYEVNIDDELVTVDTSGGDVLVNLPEILGTPDPEGILPEGTRFAVKKVTNDAGQVLLTPFPGETIEDSPAAYVLDTYLDSIILQSDGLGNWWVIGGNVQGGAGVVVDSPSFISFTTDTCVPSYGTQFLKLGTVYTSSVPWKAPSSLRIENWTISVDVADTKNYNIEILVNGLLLDTLPFPAGSLEVSGTVSQNVIQDANISIKVVRDSGSGVSLFQNMRLNLQLISIP